MSIPHTLFKYQSFNEYSLKNLSNLEIFFSNPLNFNDPYDCAVDFIINYESEFVLGFLIDIYEKTFEKNIQIGGIDYRTVRKFRRMISRYSASNLMKTNFFKDLKQKLEKNLLIKEKFKQELRKEYFKDRGVVSLSIKNDDLLMWSHYAEGHRGFCLEFDTNYLPFRDAKKVRYSVNIPNINVSDWKKPENSDNFHSPVLTKCHQWEYEEEFRIIHSKANFKYKFDAQSLVGIYFGSEIDGAHQEIISAVSLKKNRGLKFYKARRLKNRFKIEFDQIHI